MLFCAFIQPDEVTGVFHSYKSEVKANLTYSNFSFLGRPRMINSSVTWGLMFIQFCFVVIF